MEATPNEILTLRRHIAISGMTHAEIAEAAGVGERTVDRVMHDSDMKVSTYSKIRAVLRVEPSRVTESVANL